MLRVSHILFVFIFSSAIISCNKDYSIIQGEVEDPVLWNEYVYLLASDSPITKDVDSTMVLNGKFRFKIPADSTKFKVLRITPKFPVIAEDLIVITEKGEILVELAWESKGEGTPLNEALQQWKERKIYIDSIQWSIHQQRRNGNLSQAELDSINNYSLEIRNMFLEENEDMIRENFQNGIGLLIFKLFYHSFSADFKNEVMRNTGNMYFENDAQLRNIVTSISQY